MKKQKRKRFYFFVLRVFSLRILAIALVCLVLLTMPFGKDEALASVFFGGNRKIPIYCVQNDKKEIALSFDAAWGSDKTSKILDILEGHNVTANFFLVGMWVDKNEDLVRQIDSAGLEIGTHSNTHPDFTKLSKKQMQLELTSSCSKIESITGKKVSLFRAPYGAYNNDVLSVAEGLNLTTIQWDVDSLDWKGISSTQIASNIVTKVSSGSIILCHNNAEHIVEALPSVLSNLKSRGYKFVTISSLLLSGKTKIDVTGRQVRV